MNPVLLSFFVAGTPAPGGSKKGFVPTYKDGRPVRRPNGSIMVNIVEDAGDGNKQWRAVVSNIAMQTMVGKDALDGPLEVVMEFFVARPQHHYGSKKGVRYLKETAPIWRVEKPDCLKFARSTEDAMTGIIYIDDSQIVAEHISKRYSNDGKTGCQITVREVQ